jgi:hypothetical protein
VSRSAASEFRAQPAVRRQRQACHPHAIRPGTQWPLQATRRRERTPDPRRAGTVSTSSKLGPPVAVTIDPSVTPTTCNIRRRRAHCRRSPERGRAGRDRVACLRRASPMFLCKAGSRPRSLKLEVCLRCCTRYEVPADDDVDLAQVSIHPPCLELIEVVRAVRCNSVSSSRCSASDNGPSARTSARP